MEIRFRNSYFRVPGTAIDNAEDFFKYATSNEIIRAARSRNFRALLTVAQEYKRGQTPFGPLDEATSKTAKALARSDYYGIRQLVAQTYHAPEHLIYELSKDTVHEVKIAAIYNPNMPASGLLELCNDKDSRVLCAIASQVQMPEKGFMILAKNSNPAVCYAVAKNPMASTEALKILKNHPDERVRRAVKSNPHDPDKIGKVDISELKETIKHHFDKYFEAQNITDVDERIDKFLSVIKSDYDKAFKSDTNKDILYRVDWDLSNYNGRNAHLYECQDGEEYNNYLLFNNEFYTDELVKEMMTAFHNFSYYQDSLNGYSDKNIRRDMAIRLNNVLNRNISDLDKHLQEKRLIDIANMFDKQGDPFGLERDDNYEFPKDFVDPYFEFIVGHYQTEYYNNLRNEMTQKEVDEASKIDLRVVEYEKKNTPKKSLDSVISAAKSVLDDQVARLGDPLPMPAFSDKNWGR